MMILTLRNKRLSEQGITLVEMLLVLVLSATLIVFSIRQYQSWNRSKDLDRLTYNINQLFQGMSGFYYANCNLTGRLSPTTASPVLLDLDSDLVTPRYMDALASNPFVANNTSYILQFNQYTAPRTISVSCGTNCTTTKQIGTIVRWMAQVSILIKDVSNIATYQKLLQATCTSSLDDTTVSPCSAGQAGDYLVWERPASLPSGRYDVNSTYWSSTPRLQQFNQMYTTNPILTLTGSDGANQYFYCGG